LIRIEWTGRAFLQLEALPPLIAFEAIRRVDFLEKFPEMGARVRSRKKVPINYRQMIVGKYYRVLYEYEPSSETVFILAVQHTRQRMPSMRDLKRE
jgi:mRNA-degrading endonuclease RelE of RelBE toxin-antitoxin system